jgi:hypothetical protein
LKIKIERSGGFTGITSSCELNTDKLPLPVEVTIRELLDRKNSSVKLTPSLSKGAADYLNYKITIQNGMKSHVVKCSELDMDSNMKSLVSYVEKKSVKK